MAPAVERSVFHRIDASLLSLRRLVDPPRNISGSDDPVGLVEVSTVLVVDAVAGTGRATVAQVAERLSVAPSTASRLVARAVSAGMVVHEPDPLDRRRVCVTLTPRGRQLQRRASSWRGRRLAAALSSWPATEVDEFARLLDRFATDTRSLVAPPALDGHRGADSQDPA